MFKEGVGVFGLGKNSWDWIINDVIICNIGVVGGYLIIGYVLGVGNFNVNFLDFVF